MHLLKKIMAMLITCLVTSQCQKSQFSFWEGKKRNYWCLNEDGWKGPAQFNKHFFHHPTNHDYHELMSSQSIFHFYFFYYNINSTGDYQECVKSQSFNNILKNISVLINIFFVWIRLAKKVKRIKLTTARMWSCLVASTLIFKTKQCRH